MKGGHHNIEIFTYEEPLRILDENPQVEATIVNPKDFTDSKSFFYLLYKIPYIGSASITNVFIYVKLNENHAVLQMKYHMKFQTRSRTL